MEVTNFHSAICPLVPQFFRHLTKLSQAVIDTGFSNRRFQVFAQFLQCRLRFQKSCPRDLRKTIRETFKSHRVADKFDILDLFHGSRHCLVNICRLAVDLAVYISAHFF